MNLEEYKAYVEATRNAAKMSALNAILNAPKKEGK